MRPSRRNHHRRLHAGWRPLPAIATVQGQVLAGTRAKRLEFESEWGAARLFSIVGLGREVLRVVDPQDQDKQKHDQRTYDKQYVRNRPAFPPRARTEVLKDTPRPSSVAARLLVRVGDRGAPGPRVDGRRIGRTSVVAGHPNEGENRRLSFNGPAKTRSTLDTGKK